MSIIVQDITLFTVLFVCRSKTRYLLTSFKIFSRNIRVRLTVCYKASVYPKITILIRSTTYTYLKIFIIKLKNCTRSKPVIFSNIFSIVRQSIPVTVGYSVTALSFDRSLDYIFIHFGCSAFRLT